MCVRRQLSWVRPGEVWQPPNGVGGLKKIAAAEMPWHTTDEGKDYTVVLLCFCLPRRTAFPAVVTAMTTTGARRLLCCLRMDIWRCFRF